MTNWDGEERRTGPDPAALQNELRAVRQDVGRLATAVTSLGSDEKLQAAIDSVAEEQKRHWQRLTAPLFAAILVIVVVAAFGARWSRDAKDAASSAGRVSSYVDHCLVHPSEATPGECGNAAATGQQSTAVLAIFCYLRIAPEDRTDANAQACFSKAAEQARVASASVTTTTRGG